MGFLDKLFGPSEQKTKKRYQKRLDEVNSFESSIEKLSMSELKNKTQEFKKRLGKNETLESILPEAFAVVRETAKRVLGQRHYDVQIIGGIILYEGKIAEMRTGEGKTLVATLPLYLNALEGKGVHLITVNDFLAKFQGQWMGQLFHALGMNTGIIAHESSFIYSEKASSIGDQTWKYLKPISRKDAYQADITYGTNNEFGFDYLRDNMAPSISNMSQRDLNFVIIDEIDSILIDEARTPLIISAPSRKSTDLYGKFASLVKKLDEKDYTKDEKQRSASLTDSGIEKIEKWLGIENLYDPSNVKMIHHSEESLKAQVLFTKDKDYVVKDNEIIIVDEFTGRLMHGRRYSEGLHQAIEAKENVEVKQESETLATISFQNLFRLYNKLSGMTGTAVTESEEFFRIYGLEVMVVPTHKPMIRNDRQDKIYKTEEGKLKAIINEIKEKNEKGQPILVGTVSIEKNEKISKLLKKAKIPHNLLNAKNHENEAKIIAAAGHKGSVTIATNIAGRGVDIILGGTKPEEGVKEKDHKNNETSAKDSKDKKEEKPKKEVGLAILTQEHRTLKEWEKEHREVVKLGGLAVIGTARHESRRIDNQLRGRAGRQGDPGDSIFYVSMEDDLMRIFGGDRIKGMMDRLGLPDDAPIGHSMISKSIEQAQKKVEGHNFDIRKHLVEYDDVMNKHREAVYRKRRLVLDMKGKDENGNIVDLHEEILSLFTPEELPIYQKKVEKYGLEVIKPVERHVFLKVIDELWTNHLNTMEELRTGIGLRGYGQKDPLTEYKHEAFKMYEELLDSIEAQLIEILLKLEVVNTPKPEDKTEVLEQGGRQPSSLEVLSQDAKELNSPKMDPKLSGEQSVDEIKTTVRRNPKTQDDSPKKAKKIGRNDKCYCGSGKKYKKCHGA